MVLDSLYGKSQPSFVPRILTYDDFAGIDIDKAAIKKAVCGSIIYKKRFDDGILFPKQTCAFDEIDLNEELPIHDYTGKCPSQTYEINPVLGCNVGCAYCLVNDGIHEKQAIVLSNYHELLEKKLAEHRHDEHYFYFSPKTEAFCEATLQTGVAHNILRIFVEHFLMFPDSKARLFIASKAGAEALRYVHGGDSIIELFSLLKGKMQFNTSLSIFPGDSANYLEPYSGSLQSRLDAVDLCLENGIMASSALVQPILISALTDEILEEFFALLSRHGIVNFKPEFLTVCPENLSLIAQILETHDPGIFKKTFELYFAAENLNHRKQRERTAPSRAESLLWISKMKKQAERFGISASVCNWVREQLKISESDIPLVNKNGFRCLGYQTRLFEVV